MGADGSFMSIFFDAILTVVPDRFIAAGCEFLNRIHMKALSAMDTASRNATLGLAPRV